MAKITLEVLVALRNTVRRIEQTTQYQWGHMGCCNCGFLAQEITHLRKEEIHARAMQRHGDWSEQLNDYCPTSGLLIDDIIREMLAFGFDCTDLRHLERLSDPQVLNTLPDSGKIPAFNRKADVIAYLKAWANLVEARLLSPIQLGELETKREPVLH
jgi:hypothetical protein